MFMYSFVHFLILLTGRLKSLREFCTDLESAVKKFISYMKGIPGFELLSMQDQVSVVKSKYIYAKQHDYQQLFDNRNVFSIAASGCGYVEHLYVCLVCESEPTS